MASRRRRRSPKRRSSDLLLDIHAAAWLTRRFARVAAGEARRRLRNWRSRLLPGSA